MTIAQEMRKLDSMGRRIRDGGCHVLAALLLLAGTGCQESAAPALASIPESGSESDFGSESEFEPGPQPPIRLTLSDARSRATIHNEGMETWEVARDWDSGLLLWLQTEQHGAWSWSHPQCPHRRDQNTKEIEAGTSLHDQEIDVDLPRGRHRWIAWVRRLGAEWQAVASEPFEVQGFWDGPYEPWEGSMPDWDDGVRILIGEIRNFSPWEGDPEPDLFDFDIVIENRLEQEVEYNPSSNYWLCEGFGGWARHPGWTICGNQSSWPRVPPGGTDDEHSSVGRGFGRFRFGMLFQRPHRQEALAAALSEPFVVEPPAAPRR